MKSRTQPSRPRTKKSEANDRLVKDRPSRGQGHKAQVFSKKICEKSGVLQKNKKVFARKGACFSRKMKNQAFSEKRKKWVFPNFREVSADFQGKVKRRSWPSPIFKKSKNRHFPGLVGFKNFTFEAKDFKMCP